jgi:protein TonB
MVPNAEVEKILPDTLPADFGEWDNFPTAPSSPKKLDAVSGNGAAPKPPAKPATARVGLSLVKDRLLETAFLTPVAATSGGDLNIADSGNPGWPLQFKGINRRMLTVAAIASVLLLTLIVVISLRHHGSQPKVATLKQSVAPSSLSTALPAANALSATKPSAASQAANALAAPAQPEPADRVQSAMMNDQLTAPRQIPKNLRTTDSKDAPSVSGFNASGMEGLGGSESAAAGSVFGGQSGSKVKVMAPKQVSISAGVAAGLALHKTAPSYPPIAKTARVSGTVVLQAIISKAGTIQNLRVVSGPSMLQQSALDAVKSWRYRPYMLNNEPVDVETTVNVVFDLGG